MVTHMKTTVEIADPLLREAKKLARERRTTLRSLLESALRRELADRARPRRAFRLKIHTFHGKGLQPGVDLENWERVRALTYEGRGG
jgi:hypothetical protein